jgi:hypothetical protein
LVPAQKRIDHHHPFLKRLPHELEVNGISGHSRGGRGRLRRCSIASEPAEHLTPVR